MLATASVTPRQAGTLELSLGQTKVVDASGQTVSVQGSETTVRVQVGGGGPLYGAPVAGPRPSGKVSQQAPGPFDLSKDGVVDHADSVLVALGWTQLRQQGVVCGPRVDPTLDVNHDGCLDVADAQLIASHFGESAPKALPAADAPMLADAVSADEAGDGSELSVATVGDVVALAAPLLEVVNTTDDTDDVTPGDGVCRTAAGNCSVNAWMKSSMVPLRDSFRRATSFAECQRVTWYFGIESGRSRYTPPGR